MNERGRVQVFKTKAFARFARQQSISDGSLCEAIRRAERGLIDAELGGGVIKQRVARPGQGRSGGYRVLAAYRVKVRSVFLFGFAKSERENVNDDELKTLQDIAKACMRRAFSIVRSTRKSRCAIWERRPYPTWPASPGRRSARCVSARG